MVIDDLLDARLLSEIGARLSFTAAANALDVPAATVSRRVARMEREAGLRLFERTSRRVEVTEAGALVIERARRMIDATDEVDAVLEEARGAPSGAVRVTAMHDMATLLLTDVTTEFLDRYPDCQLAVTLTDRKVDLVREGVDVAIRANAPGGNELVVRRLGAVRLRLHARPKVANAIRTIEDLASAPFGLFGLEGESPGPGPVHHPVSVRDGDGNECVLDVRPRIEINDFCMLRTAAMERDLVVGLPTGMTREDVAAGRLAPVLPGHCGVDLDLFAVLPSRRHMRPAVRAFVDIAAARMGQILREADAAIEPDARPTIRAA